MRILHVVQGYAPALGGTEFMVQKVSEKLVALFGDEVTVYTANGYNCELFWNPQEPSLPVGTEMINGVHVQRFPVFNSLSWFWKLWQRVTYQLRLPYHDWWRTIQQGPLVRGLTRTIADFQADVIMASSFPLMHMFNALRGGRGGGTPVVFVGGLHPEDPWGFERRNIYRAIQQVDAYIGYTTFERDYLIKQGIGPGKLHVIGLGVEPAQFVQAEGRKIRARSGWDANAPVIAFIGQQTGHKGLDTLILAMQRVWRVCPEARLLIAGARSAFSVEIDRLIAGLSPEDRQRLMVVGRFPEVEKAEYFAAVDIFAYPSGFESFGIAYLEAWAAGKPVIGCRAGAVPTVIDEGRDGLLVQYQHVEQLAAALLQLLRHPAQRERMGRAGQAKVLREYTWDIVAGRFRGVYQRVVRKKRR